MEILNPELLEKCISEEKNGNIKIKLLCLNAIYHGMKVKDVITTFKIPSRNIYRWRDYWNQSGYEGLVPTKQPGRPSRLTPKEFDELKLLLIDKQIFTTKDVKMIIKEKFNVNFSLVYTARILREKFKFHHKKPYVLSSKRPKGAEEILKQDLNQVIEDLKRNSTFNLKKLAIGFLDESSSQNNSNTVRLWSSVENPTILKNPKRLKANTIGFYSIIGNSVVNTIPDSKQESICNFLIEISDKNIEYDEIILILDNFKTHHSKLVETQAKKLNIHLIFLPPYSPDLNPIEYIWKSIKRILSEKNFKLKQTKKNSVGEL